MRLRLLGSSVLALLATVGFGQTVAEYFKLRNAHGIRQPSGVEALQTLVGSRVLEVDGIVKGTVGVEGSYQIILEAPGGEEVYVESPQIETWLIGNEVRARLLIRAERVSEYSGLRSKLLGVAPEAPIAAYDAKEEAKRKKTQIASRSASLPKTKQAAKTWYLPTSDALPYYAAFIQSRNRRLSEREASRIAQSVLGFSLKFGVDARLIMAMVMVESGFNPNATSRAGAMGLGQLMPGTARGLGVSDAYDTVDNLFGTVKLVRGHLEKYHAKTGDPYDSLILTLAAYNAGSGAVRKHGGVPPYRETQNYVRKVVEAYRSFCQE